MRGGTSRAIMFRREDLPADEREWDAIFLAAMGSPDPNGRQLDGMGGGISSLSKVCVVGPPSRDDADVDYTFAQVAVDEALVAAGRAVYRQNYCGTCHTLAAAETGGVFGPAHDHVATLALDRLDDPDYRGVATNAAEYIRESILKPEIYIAPGSMLAHQQMPPFTHLSADDVDALVYFLMQQK